MSKRSKPFFLALLAATLLLSGPADAASIRIKSGSLDFLKQEKQVNVEVECSDMKVGRKQKECVPEKEYVAQLNQKHAGHGDMWKLEWTGSLPSYQSKFQELLNKQIAAGDVSLQFGTFKSAKYTLVLKLTSVVTETAGFAPRPPLISADVVFVETENRANTVAVVQIEKMPGQGAWAAEMREAFAKAGKDLGILIRKKIN